MNILIISYYFPPRNGPAGERVFSYAKHLAQSHNQVTVLTTKWEGSRNQNCSGLNVLHVGNAPNHSNRVALIKSKIPKVIKKYLNTEILNILPILKFLNPAARWEKKAFSAVRQVCTAKKVDLIVTSHPPASVIKIGARIKKEFPRIKWVIDYRDLWSKNSMADFAWITAKVLESYERKTIRKLDACVTVSKGFIEEQKSLLPGEVSSKLIYNGYVDGGKRALINSAANSQVKKSQGKHWVYTGSLYQGLRDINPIIRYAKYNSSVILDIAVMDNLDASLVQSSAGKYQLAEKQLNLYVNLDHDKALQLQEQADVLLVLFRRDGKDKTTIPSKFFEYLKTGKPIVVFGHKEAEIGTILRETESGFLVSDYTELEAIGTDPKIVSVNPKLNKLAYTRSHQAERFAEFLVEICQGSIIISNS